MKFNKRFLVLLILTLLFYGCTKNRDKTLVSDIFIPQKIISLSPAATEILFAIGAENQVAAVSDFSDYPLQALDLPKVGGFDGQTLSIEKIISFNPDFVYLTDGMHNFLIEQLEQLGIHYYISKATSYDAVKQEILDIGQITGHLERAQTVVDEMDKKISNLPVRAMIFTFYYEVWNSPYITCGKSSFISDALDFLSTDTNIFSDLEEDYPIVGEESIIARNPDIILLPASNGVTIESVMQRAGWENITAVKNNNIYIIDDNLFSRPGPRIVEAIEIFNNLVNSSKK